MRQYDESYCLAILVTNLKSRNRYPDPITVAECAKFLYETYGSYQQVAKMVYVHPSVIRKWTILADAPETLRNSVKEGKIYPVAAFAILSAFSDDDKREEVAREVIGWGEPEIVRFIRFIKSNPGIPIPECKNEFVAEIMRKLLQSDSAFTENE